jgi:hypothetical protein
MLMAQEPFASAEIEYRRSQISRFVSRRRRDRAPRGSAPRLPQQGSRPRDGA